VFVYELSCDCIHLLAKPVLFDRDYRELASWRRGRVLFTCQMSRELLRTRLRGREWPRYSASD
jgi:hypothetical protein